MRVSWYSQASPSAASGASYLTLHDSLRLCRNITRPDQGAVVSLEIPRIVVSLEIPVFRIFFVKKSGKIIKICFFDSRDQNKILNFFDSFNFFIYGQYFLYEPLFPSSQLSKSLKIKTARSKSTRVPTYRSFGPPGTCFSPVLWSKLPFLTLS